MVVSGLSSIVRIKSAEWIPEESRNNLERLPFVRGKIKFIGDHEIEVIVDEANTAIPELVQACQGEGITVETTEQVLPPFDDVFVRLIERENANDQVV
jgi:hypothetical protein